MSETHSLKVTTPSDREIVLERAFNAPSHRVFDALTKCEFIERWFAPPGWILVACQVDLRKGGVCRLTMRGRDGEEMVMRAVYREIRRPERIVRDESFTGWPIVESIVTCSEHAGRTTMRATIVFPSRETRDADIESGMDRDAAAAYESLAALLT